jgi:hypothetical protein
MQSRHFVQLKYDIQLVVHEYFRHSQNDITEILS